MLRKAALSQEVGTSGRTAAANVAVILIPADSENERKMNLIQQPRARIVSVLVRRSSRADSGYVSMIACGHALVK